MCFRVVSHIVFFAGANQVCCANELRFRGSAAAVASGEGGLTLERSLLNDERWELEKRKQDKGTEKGCWRVIKSQHLYLPNGPDLGRVYVHPLLPGCHVL